MKSGEMGNSIKRPSGTEHLHPKESTCCKCGSTLKKRYTRRRRVSHLDKDLTLILHYSRCGNPNCENYNKSIGPNDQEHKVLKKYRYGLDVIMLIGKLRNKKGKTITEIHKQLKEKYLMSISLKEVSLLNDAYLALVNPSTSQGSLPKEGVLSIDGVRPEGRSEVVWILQDCETRKVLHSETLASADTSKVAEMIQEVINKGYKPLGVVSDGQYVIHRGVEKILGNKIPYQTCHFHFLRYISKESLNCRDIRLARNIRREFQRLSRFEKEKHMYQKPLVSLLRTILTKSHKYPFKPCGKTLYENLTLIREHLKFHKQIQNCQLMAIIKKTLKTNRKEYLYLSKGYDMLKKAANILEKGTLRQLRALFRHPPYGLSPWAKKALKATYSNVFGNKLFTYRKYPFLPKTNNTIEQLVNKLKKTFRLQSGGRKNVSRYLTNKGSYVLFAMQIPDDYTIPTPVDYEKFRKVLDEIKNKGKKIRKWQRNLESALAEIKGTPAQNLHV